MKRYIISIIAVLLSLQVSAKNFNEIQGVLRLIKPNIEVSCAYDTTYRTVTLGNGYNACISTTYQGEVEIPGRVEYNGRGYDVDVAKFAFRLCDGITKFTIGDGARFIGDFAFVGCSNMTEVVLPRSVSEIGTGAFCDLENLRIVRCDNTSAPSWAWNDVFSSLGTKESMRKKALKRTLIVPKDSRESYIEYKFDGTSTGKQTKANEKVGWRDAFAHILEDNGSPYEINSVEGLMAFREAVNDGTVQNFHTENFVLTADLDMAAVEGWTGIGNSTNKFTGTFNGNGHVIKNLHVYGDEPNMGLFGYVENATIYNLHLMNPVVNSQKYAGALVGFGNNMHIKDILVTSNDLSDGSYTITSDGFPAGGIIGYATSSTIENSMFQGKVKSPGCCGGIVGKLEGYSDVFNCMVNCEVRQTGDDENIKGTGGIIGETTSVNMERCFVKAYTSYDVTSPQKHPGYAIGETSIASDPSTIANCAYWVGGAAHNLLQNSASNNDVLEGNQSYADANDMLNASTEPVLGSEDWFYFTGHKKDYPVPVTLKDMYLANVIDTEDANGLVYRRVGEGSAFYEVAGYTGNATNLTIPDTYNNINVIGIEDDVFKDNATLTTVQLGSNITYIGDRAFYDCDALTAIDLPDAVETLGKNAFAYCDELTSFNIGRGLREVKDNFLAYCPKLTSITATRGNGNDFKCVNNVLLHNPAINIDNDGYVVACAAGNTGDYVIPVDQLNQNIHFYDKCFAGCTNLTSITLPTRYYSLGKGMFDGAYNLRYIDMMGLHALNNVSYKADRDDENSPFYGLSNYTIVYLPTDHTAAPGEPNIIINGITERLELDEEWDFVPKVPTITATNGVEFTRSIEPSIVEMASATDEEITIDDQTVKLMNLRYEYADAGYTCFLPYSVDLNEEDKIKVYKPTSAGLYTGESNDPLNGKTVITFTEVESKHLDALTPYFLLMSDTTSVYLDTYESVTINCDEVNSFQLGDYEFKGTLVNIPNTTLYDSNKPAYLLQSDGNWHQVPQNQPLAFIGPYRAYFQATSATQSAKTMQVTFKDFDAPSGIDAIIRTRDSDGSERYYDINGRRLNGKPQKGLYIHNGKKMFAK